jgi:tripartite-type tricarboxylate transporter receptor subunit TctC
MKRSAVGARVIAPLTFSACTLLLASALHAQADFFQGKSLRLIRGAQAGDLYDLWTRRIATYLGKHVPGHPSVTVQNMPGAGSEKDAQRPRSLGRCKENAAGRSTSLAAKNSPRWQKR